MKKKGIFDEFGIEITKNNAKAVEEMIAEIIGIEGHCPEVWRETKIWLEDDIKRNKLSTRLRKKFSK